MVFSISKQYTDTPGPRYRRQGDFSGEQFREEHLESLFDVYKSSHTPVVIELDGTFGYPTSFLEEAFGGLAREHPVSEVLAAFQFVATEQPSIVAEIINDIRHARDPR